MTKSNTNNKINKLNGEVSSAVLEVRKTLVTVLVGSFSFFVALVWRDVLASFFTDILDIEWGTTFYGSLASALVITFVTVLILVFITKYLSVEDKK